IRGRAQARRRTLAHAGRCDADRGVHALRAQPSRVSGAYRPQRAARPDGSGRKPLAYAAAGHTGTHILLPAGSADAMNSRLTFHIAVMLIAAIGVATAWVRHTQTQIPLLPGAQQQVWLVESRVDFVADGGPVTVSLSIPKAPPGFRLLTEQTASPGYGFAVVEDRGERRGEWTIRSARGPQTLYYKAQLVPDPAPPPPAAAPEPPAAVVWEEPQATAARQLLERAAATSSTPQSLTRELIKLLTAVEPDQNTALLLSAHPPVLVLDKLLRQA